MMCGQPLYPEPPAALVRPGWRYLLTYVGPGAIIASVTIGSGELVWASRSGAIFGYAMLWCFLFGGTFKAIQVYTAARHITLTGEHPMRTWQQTPVLRWWFPLLIALPAVALMPVAFSAIPEILGGYIHGLADRAAEGPNGIVAGGAAVGPWGHEEFWINVWATLVLAACLTLALGSSYGLLERVSAAVLGVMVLCVGVSVVVLGPDLLAMVRGLLVPRVPDFPQWLVDSPKYAAEIERQTPWLEVSLYLAAVGGGAYDYIGYIGMMRHKQWGLAGRRVAGRQELEQAVSGQSRSAEQNVRRARQWVRGPLFDTGVSFFFVVLVTLLFAVLGTLVLHPEHAVPANNDLLIEQETFLTQLHGQLRWLYRGGVFLAIMGTLYGAFEVYRYTFAESLAAVAPRLVTDKRLPGIRAGVVAYCFLGGLVVMWLPEGIAGAIIDRVIFSTILSGALASGLWCFAMLLVDYVRLPAPLRMGTWLRIVTVTAGVAMTWLGVLTTIAFLRAKGLID